MKKIKRKYIRKVSPDAPGCDSTPLKEESSIVDRVTGEITEVKPDNFSFNDLPLSIRMRVDQLIAYRKRLNLPDDSKKRKELAIRMFRGERLR